MIKIQKIIISIFLLTLISACTINSPRGSYSQLQLSTNIHRIEVVGKRSTPHQSVKDFALLKAAEITLKNNKQRFIIIADNIERMAEQITFPAAIIDTQTINGKIVPIYSQPEIDTKYRSSGTLTIELIGKNDNRYKSAYDALIIINQLSPVFNALDSKGNETNVWLKK